MSRRSGVMLCYKFDERRLERWGFPVLVQPKINGVRCRTVLSTHEGGGGWPRPKGSLILHSSEANEITSVPHVLGEVKRLYSLCLSHLIDGELYVHGMPLGDIISITSRTVNLHPDHKRMEYHIFDVVDKFHTMGQRALSMMYMKGLISKLMLAHLKIVPTLLADSLGQITQCKEKWIEEGYEGIIIRRYAGEYKEKKSTDIMKIKKRKMLTAYVYGCVEEETIHHVRKGTLGAAMCKLNDHSVFKVGTGFTAQQRKEWWPDYLLGKWVRVEYQELTKAGVPYAPSFKGIVQCGN